MQPLKVILVSYAEIQGIKLENIKDFDVAINKQVYLSGFQFSRSQTTNIYELIH